ncbi:MAG: cytochrome d ubiquinol oxidase subunit II [Planctomycetota bacterium]
MSPESAVYGILLAAVAAHLVFGGADFGMGLWGILRSVRDSEAEERRVHRMMGPVWEANHVWLVFVFALFFTVFPPAFSAFVRSLWVPLLLAAGAVGLRGAGFAFGREPGNSATARDFWRGIFIASSAAAPFFLGATVGAALSGGMVITAGGKFLGNRGMDWMNPVSLATGAAGAAASAWLGAAALAREADRSGDVPRASAWRRRAVIAAVIAAGFFGLVRLGVAPSPSSPAAISAEAGAAAFLLGIAGVTLLLGRFYTVAAVASALAAAAGVASLGLAWYPRLVGSFTAHTAKAPDAVLWILTAAIAAGFAVVLPSFAGLYYLFRGGKRS